MFDFWAASWWVFAPKLFDNCLTTQQQILWLKKQQENIEERLEKLEQEDKSQYNHIRASGVTTERREFG